MHKVSDGRMCTPWERQGRGKHKRRRFSSNCDVCGTDSRKVPWRALLPMLCPHFATPSGQPPNFIGVSKNAVEYTSTQDMKDDLIKHRRMKKDPMDKYKGPMTESQSIGWHEEEVFNERFPKNSCAETKYADEMIKSRLDPF